MLFTLRILVSEVALGDSFSEDVVSDAVADFRVDLDSAVHLAHWLPIEDGVEVSEQELALCQPLDLEVGHQTDFSTLILKVLRALELNVVLVLRVWLALHPHYAVDTLVFSETQDQNEVVARLERFG